jgi:hypothetical protein
VQHRPLVLVGKAVAVREPATEPAYFTDAHRRWVGRVGTIHAVVAAQPRDQSLIKVKFDGEQIVFYRLADLDVLHDEPHAPPEKHGRRASHLPKGD